MKNLFKKSFSVGSQSLVRGSDKKKLKEKISQIYKPRVTVEQLDNVIHNKRDLGLVKVQNQPISLYCQVGDPLFFEYQGSIYPTIYALAQLPSMLPVVVIHPPVFNYIAKGAGIVNVDEVPSNQGQIVSIVLNGSLSPVALGFTLPFTNFDKQQLNGKAISVIHYIDDQLWDYGTKQINFTVFNQDESKSLDIEQTINQLSLKEETEEEVEEDDDDDEAATTTTTTTTTNSTSANNLNTKDEMDNIVLTSFMGAIKFGVEDSELPITLKTFFNKHMLYYAPSDTIEININKSSYKKVSKLIEVMKKKRYIDSTEPSPGNIFISKINRSNQEYKEFQLGSVVGENKQNEEAKEINEPYGNQDSETIPIKSIQDVYSLPKPLVDFSINKIPYKKYYTYIEIRNLAMEYVKQVLDSKSANIVLDEVCSQLVKQPGGTTMGKNQFYQTIKNHLSPRFMEIVFGDNIETQYTLFKQITIHSRKISNKFVIEVTGLETFSISPKELAKDGMKAFAASTTLSQFSKTSQLVKIQGNDTDRVSKYLQQHYNIPSAYIDIKIDPAVLKKK